MVKSLIEKGKNLLYGRQANILSAASVIMIMIMASRILGLIRNRVFVHYFSPEQLDTYLAAFQIPDLIFEVLVLGAMSSAFIPIFTRKLAQHKEKEAWHLAGLTLNAMLSFFSVIFVLIFIFAKPLYSLVAQGFNPEQIRETVMFTRTLLLAQLFFTASYVFTAILESNQRFLAPAIAPIFYNLGIILATVFGAPTLGLMAPVWGAVIGSLLHLSIQVPLAVGLGFRPVRSFNLKDPALKKIAKLALPRVVEMSFFQARRLTDLFMASLVAGGLTYFKFADSIAVLPISLFGLAIAKASLPQLSRETSGKNRESFKLTFSSSLRQILFFVVPVSVLLAILRRPIVRLAFGGSQFDWEDTEQTGYALSAFALGIFAYSLSLLISRAFYALHDTITPVKVSFVSIIINIALGLFLVLGLKLDIWALALSYSVAGIVQFVILFTLLARKVNGFGRYGLGTAFTKIVSCAALSGAVMFVLLKLFDRSAWDQRLSFLGHLGLKLPTTLDKFVLDTRYTANLIALTFFVGAVGIGIYLLATWFLGVRELKVVVSLVKRLSFSHPKNFKESALLQNETGSN